MTRRTHLAVLAALAAPASSVAKESNMFQELLEMSQKDKKGVMIYVKGQSIAGVVVKITGDVIELRSREYSRIMVRVESIDAVALS